MAGFIKDWIINIIALVLLIVLLEIIMPSGKTKKYVNLVTGFILIIAIINPFIKLIKGGISLESLQLAGSSEVQRLEIEKSGKLYKKEQMKQITEVYRQKVIKQLERSAEETDGVADAEADVIINEDYESESFGEIRRAYINIVPKTEEGKAKTVDSVRKVRVKLDMYSGNKGGSGTGEALKETDNAGVDSRIVRDIEDKAGRLFNIKADNIIVGLQEK